MGSSFSASTDATVILFWKETEEYYTSRGRDSRLRFGSNWTPSEFEDPIYGKFVNGEQRIMYLKAVLMGDNETCKKIMNSKDPKEIKKLGRNVAGWDQNKWDANISNIALTTTFLKFNQNPEMKEWLLSTGDLSIAEASPYDKIWGIGVEWNDPRAADLSNWDQLGQNILGKALMETRLLLQEGKRPLYLKY